MNVCLTVLVLMSQIPTYLVSNNDYSGTVVCSCRHQKQTCFNNTDVTLHFAEEYSDKETIKYCDNVVSLSLVKINVQLIHRFLSSDQSGGIIFLKISFSENFDLLEGSKLFENMPQLKELKLLKSNITRIPPKMVWKLKRLKLLNLNGNNLKLLQKHNFQDVSNPRELHLKNNKIVKIEPNTFQHLNFLRILNNWWAPKLIRLRTRQSRWRDKS